MDKKNQTNIALEKIKDLKFSFSEPNEKIKNKFDTKKLRVGFNLSFNFSLEEDLFNLILGIKYEYPQDDNDIELLDYSFKSTFHINNLEDVIEIEDENNVTIPDELVTTLFSISVSTARGLLAEKTKDLFVNQFYLPIINPKIALEKIKEAQS